MDKPALVSGPPLTIWALLLLTTAALLGWIRMENKRVTARAAAALDSCLIARAEAAGSRPVVLVIGTSLTQAGLDSTGRICRCIEQNTGAKIVLLKCWQSGSDLASLTENHAALFRRLHPSVVLLEANTLFYRPLRQAALSRYMQTFRDLVRNRNKIDVYDPDDRGVVTLGDRAALAAFRAGLVDSASLVPFLGICKEWQRQAVRIGLINFPLEKIAEKDKWNSPDTTAFFNNLRFLRSSGPVSYYDAGLRLDSSYFFDFGHLNRKGSDEFSPWFCRILSTEADRYVREHKMLAR